MPLTRNLYREDEVSAALIFCIIRGRHVETAFWCLEMLDSGMAEELCATLYRAWQYGIGVRGLGWLKRFRAETGEDLDADRMLQLAVGLSMCVKDRTIMTVIATDVSAQPDRVNFGVAKGGPLEAFTTLALQQGKTLAAWGAVHGLQEPDVFLRRAAVARHGIAGRDCFLLLEDRAEVVAAISLRRDEFRSSWLQPIAAMPAEVETSLSEWRETHGRQRRVFSIPVDCLYYFTERGRKTSVYDTTEKEIMGRLEKPGALWGSTYWDEIADWAAVRGDDDVREAFYDEHFPDDCPDEWSKADRAKSHGPGPLQKGATATAAIAFHRLIGRLPSIIWGDMPPMPESPVKPAGPIGWNLKAVKRRLVLC